MWPNVIFCLLWPGIMRCGLQGVQSVNLGPLQDASFGSAEPHWQRNISWSSGHQLWILHGFYCRLVEGDSHIRILGIVLSKAEIAYHISWLIISSYFMADESSIMVAYQSRLWGPWSRNISAIHHEVTPHLVLEKAQRCQWSKWTPQLSETILESTSFVSYLWIYTHPALQTEYQLLDHPKAANWFTDHGRDVQHSSASMENNSRLRVPFYLTKAATYQEWCELDADSWLIGVILKNWPK